MKNRAGHLLLHLYHMTVSLLFSIDIVHRHFCIGLLNQFRKKKQKGKKNWSIATVFKNDLGIT